MRNASSKRCTRPLPNDLLSSAQLGFLRLNRQDYAGAQPLLDQVLKGDDDELADRVRAALKLPQTLRKRASSTQQTSEEAKALAEKSMKAGYMKDALKYLTIAHENDPVDFGVMLKLGWVYNILHDDQDAMKWFNLASKSPDAAISEPASKAYHNLAPSSRCSAPPCGSIRSFPPAGTMHSATGR